MRAEQNIGVARVDNPGCRPSYGEVHLTQRENGQATRQKEIRNHISLWEVLFGHQPEGNLSEVLSMERFLI
jgi:hypothetical protein